MNLRQLKSFLLVCEEGSFAKAATRMGSTQPGLSVQISSLEAELNVTLFRRHARGVEPTAIGQHLYRRGLRLLEEVNTVTQEIVARAGKVVGALSAGISPALGRAVLASVLIQFVDEFPNVELRVSEDYSATLLSLIENRALDFAILAHIPNHPTIRFKHFYQDRFVIVCSRDVGIKPYAPVRLDVAPYRKLVVPSVHHGLRSALELPFRTGRIVADRVIEVNSLVSVLDFVSRSDWIALLPYTSVHYGLDTTKLQINAIEGPEVRMDYYIAYAATQPMSAAADAFVRITERELENIHADSERLISGVKKESRASRPRKAARSKRG